MPEKPIPSPKAVQTVDEEKTCLPSTLPLCFGEVTYPFPNHFNRCLVLFQKWDILVPWWLFSHSFFCSPLPMSHGSQLVSTLNVASDEIHSSGKTAVKVV